MTLDYERFWAVKNTRAFLLELGEHTGPIKKTELRYRIYRCLKHYPEDYWLNKVEGILKEHNIKDQGYFENQPHNLKRHLMEKNKHKCELIKVDKKAIELFKSIYGEDAERIRICKICGGRYVLPEKKDRSLFEKKQEKSNLSNVKSHV